MTNVGHPASLTMEETLARTLVMRRELQIAEWSMQALKDSVFRDSKLDTAMVQAEIEELRSRDKIILQEQISCVARGNELQHAQQIFEAAEKGNVNDFVELTSRLDVNGWTFKLGEYGDTTPLHWAALHGQREIVKVIRSHTIHQPPIHTTRLFNATDKFGFRPLHLAVFSYLVVPRKEAESRVKGVLDELREWTEQTFGYFAPQNAGDQPPRPWEAPIGVAEDVECHPCKIYHINENTGVLFHDNLGSHVTPLHLAIWFTPKGIVQSLLKNQVVYIPAQTGYGHTVLHLAAWKGRHEILELILRVIRWLGLPADIVNYRDFNRQTALHLSVLSRSKECVSMLLNRSESIKLNQRNSKGYTPFEFATVLRAYTFRITEDDLRRLGVTTALSVQSLGGTNKSGKSEMDDTHGRGKHHMSSELEEIISYFDGLDPDALQEDRQVYVNAANAILVGAALIASASFGAWLQPPLGYQPYYSEDFLVTNPAAPPGTYRSFVAIEQYWLIQLFWVFNSLSFFFAIATVIAGADAALPRRGLILKDAVKIVRHGVVWASYLLFAAVLCAIGTFSTIGFATLPPIPKYRINMFCTMSVGVAVCNVILIRFLQKLGSWTSLKRLIAIEQCKRPTTSL